MPSPLGTLRVALCEYRPASSRRTDKGSGRDEPAGARGLGRSCPRPRPRRRRARLAGRPNVQLTGWRRRPMAPRSRTHRVGSTAAVASSSRRARDCHFILQKDRAGGRRRGERTQDAGCAHQPTSAAARPFAKRVPAPPLCPSSACLVSLPVTKPAHGVLRDRIGGRPSKKAGVVCAVQRPRVCGARSARRRRPCRGPGGVNIRSTALIRLMPTQLAVRSRQLACSTKEEGTAAR